MSFLSRIFGQKGEAAPARRLTEEQAERLSRQKLSTIDCAPAVQIYDAVREQTKSARQHVSRLREAPMPAEIDPRLKSAARESREQVALWLEGLLNDIALPKKQDFDSFIAFRQNFNAALLQLTKGNPKHGYYTGLVFKNEMGAIGKDIAALNESAGRLGVFLDSAISQNAAYKTLVDLVESRRSLEKELKGGKASMDELRKTADSESKEVEALRKRRESAQRPDEGGLSGLVAKRAAVEEEMYSFLAPLSRPLKKYANMGAFDKKTGALLEGYINEPVKTALSDGSGELKKILTEVERLIKGGQMDLKENVSEKALSAIAEAREGRVERLAASHAKLSSEIADAETRNKPLLEKSRQLEEQTASAEAKLEAARSSLSMTEKTLKQKEELLADVQKKIGAALAQIPS